MPIAITKTFKVSPFRHLRDFALAGQPPHMAHSRRIDLRFYWLGDWSFNNVREAFDTCEREAKRLLSSACIGATSRIEHNRCGKFILIEVPALEKDVDALAEILKDNGFKEGK